MGEYDETAKIMANQIEEFMYYKWVNIIGGCCGTTPKHIESFSKSTLKYEPRVIPNNKLQLKLSGLEALTVSTQSN